MEIHNKSLLWYMYVNVFKYSWLKTLDFLCTHLANAV